MNETSSPYPLFPQPSPCTGPVSAGVVLPLITIVLAFLVARFGSRAHVVAHLETRVWWRSIRRYGSCATAAIDALATLVGLLTTSLSLASLPASCSAWEYPLRLCPAFAGLAVKVVIGYLRDHCGRPTPTRQQRNAVKVRLEKATAGTLGNAKYFANDNADADVFEVQFDPEQPLALATNMALLVEWANREEGITNPAFFTKVKLVTRGSSNSALPPLGSLFELATAPAHASSHSSHSARVAAYLDCSQEESFVAVVTAGHLPTDGVAGVLDGLSLELLGRVDPGHADAARSAIAVNVIYSHGTQVQTYPAAVDVGAFAVKSTAGESLHELPCCGDPSLPSLDSCDATMLSYFDGTNWLRFVLSGVVSCRLPLPTGSGEPRSDVVDLRHVAVAAAGTPTSARLPTIGDSGAPFFDSRGHLHSFLVAVELQGGRPVRWELVPAAAALAQLRALLGPRGYRIGGFLAPEPVHVRAASLRGPSALVSLGRVIGRGLLGLFPAAAPGGGGGRGPTGYEPAGGENGRLLDEGHGGKKDQ